MNDKIIAIIDQARTLLAEVQSIADIKQAIDQARAIETYAKRQRMSTEIIDLAHEIKIEAQRKLGEVLEAEPKNQGTRGQLLGRNFSGGINLKPPENPAPTLAAYGLTKVESATAQKVARIARLAPEDYEALKKRKLSLKSAIRRMKRQERGDVNRSGDDDASAGGCPRDHHAPVSQETSIEAETFKSSSTAMPPISIANPHYNAHVSVFQLLSSALWTSVKSERSPGCEERQRKLESLVNEYSVLVESSEVETQLNG